MNFPEITSDRTVLNVARIFLFLPERLKLLVSVKYSLLIASVHFLNLKSLNNFQNCNQNETIGSNPGFRNKNKEGREIP